MARAPQHAFVLAVAVVPAAIGTFGGNSSATAWLSVVATALLALGALAFGVVAIIRARGMRARVLYALVGVVLGALDFVVIAVTLSIATGNYVG